MRLQGKLYDTTDYMHQLCVNYVNKPAIILVQSKCKGLKCHSCQFLVFIEGLLVSFSHSSYEHEWSSYRKQSARISLFYYFPIQKCHANRKN